MLSHACNKEDQKLSTIFDAKLLTHKRAILLLSSLKLFNKGFLLSLIVMFSESHFITCLFLLHFLLLYHNINNATEVEECLFYASGRAKKSAFTQLKVAERYKYSFFRSNFSFSQLFNRFFLYLQINFSCAIRFT